MTRKEFLETLKQLNLWKRGTNRAPHKPLLLLWALGRVRQGKHRLASYEHDVEGPLKSLLADFGPWRKVLHPENPFWHLQTEGIWEIAGDKALAVAPGRSATRSALVKNHMRGGLSESLYKRLRRDSQLIRAAANVLLYDHFPESMHDAIRERVGLPHDSTAMVREGKTLSQRPRRDPEFRAAVLRAYERRCTICDFDLRIADCLFGLDAAHIMWHSHGGPDRVPNGLALCTFHHNALDRGVIGLEPESGNYRLLVSNELTGQSPAFSDVLGLRGQRLRPPQESEFRPSLEYVQWHRKQVFRGTPRSSA